MLLCAALACGAGAQTYQVDSGSGQNAKTQDGQSQSSNQPLGWGSNIQNARLARAAQLALQHGDYGSALDFAQRASQAAPNDPQLWFLLGYAARLNHRYEQAVDAYNRGLHLAPSTLDGISGLAQVYSMMGRSDDAERALKQVMAADPRRRDDALLLGEMYLHAGKYPDAIVWIGNAERLKADARAETLLAMAYQQTKQMDQANHYLELARKHAPDDPNVERSLAGYFRETGKYSEAIAALKSIRNPGADITAELADTYQLDGRAQDAATLFAQAAKSRPNDIAMQLSAAQSQIAANAVGAANPFLDRAAAIDPGFYRLHAIRGEIAQIEERNEDAVREYSAALGAMPANPAEGPLYGIQLRMDLVALYRKAADENAVARELDHARTEINAIDGSGPVRGRYLRLRALIRMNSGDLDGALSDIHEALALNTGDRDDLQLNGDVLMKLGRTEDAIAVYKKILDRDPANKSALTSLGFASRAAGRDKDAEMYFQRLAQVAPDSYAPFLALGDLYAARRDFKAADASYSKGYDLSPNTALIVAGGMNAAIEAHDLPLAAKWMARTTDAMGAEPQVLREKERYLSFAGKYQESAKVGEVAIKTLPRDRDVVVYLGYDYLNLQRWDDLLALTTQYLTILPKEPDLPLLEGYVHKHTGQKEQARADFTEALNRDPTVVTAYINRGYMENDLGDPKSAASDFEAALKREPGNGEAHLGLAYSSLDLQKPKTALEEANLAERAMGDSRDLHVIRATAYGREEMLAKSAEEYRAALKFTPDDGALHLGLANALFSLRLYHDAVGELQIAEKYSPQNAEVEAMLARSYASLLQRDPALKYVQLAEEHALPLPPAGQGAIYVSTGQALSALGDQSAAMDRFRRALNLPNSDRVSVRLAIAQLMAQQSNAQDAERQIALAWMEATGGDTAPPNGNQYVAAADVLRSIHDYELSQSYLERAKAAGAPDAEVRVGLADTYLARGDTARAQAELSAVSAETDSAPYYRYLLAEANVFQQEHEGARALTSFAQASSAEGEDQEAEQSMLAAGADEGMRVTPTVSVLSQFAVEPVFEDTTVYVLDSKLDAKQAVPSSEPSLLPPPRSSVQTEWTNAFHLHLAHLPAPGGFFQVRNAQGQISVPSVNSIVNRNTTDYNFNFGLAPTLRLGSNAITLDGGLQETVRRDSESPVQMNQNLFRQFLYLSTSSFFNEVSVSGYAIHESGPFTESNINSRMLAAAVDFRVGAPWGRTALVTGWGANDQLFRPVGIEDYYTSSYAGVERKLTEHLDVRAIAEDLRAWRIVGKRWAIAQDLRPAASVDYTFRRNWALEASSAFSSTRGSHIYDATQNGFSVSYAMPVHRKFEGDSGPLVLAYPIRFAAGMQQETFFNFPGSHSEQLRPYVSVSIF